jgi:hypothetical protein
MADLTRLAYRLSDAVDLGLISLIRLKAINADAFDLIIAGRGQVKANVGWGQLHRWLWGSELCARLISGHRKPEAKSLHERGADLCIKWLSHCFG